VGLIKNSLHLSLGKVSEKLAAILIIPLLTGALTQEQYGQLVLSYSFSSVYIVVVTSGLNTWLFNDFTKNNFNLTEKSLKTYLYYLLLEL
jgi:O-antigen/teichoic acid export membrane protein